MADEGEGDGAEDGDRERHQPEDGVAQLGVGRGRDGVGAAHFEPDEDEEAAVEEHVADDEEQQHGRQHKARTHDAVVGHEANAVRTLRLYLSRSKYKQD